MNTYSISGQVVLPTGARPATIVVDPVPGTIVSVEDPRVEVNPELWIFPGFIDMHVHAREYPLPDSADAEQTARREAQCRKETFSTAGLAAINGGVTLFGAMPNDPIPPSDERSYSLKQAIADASAVPVVLYGLVTRESRPWEDAPFKVYLDADFSALSFSDWTSLEEALSRYRGCRVFFHAEDPETLRNSPKEGPRWVTRPPEAEIVAVEKVLELSAKLGLNSHICHISTERSVRLITEYNRDAGQRVSCEVTPHHLFFSVDHGKVSCALNVEVQGSAGLLGSNPPLRSESDRLFMVEALRNGEVDVLASDHAPHTLDDKRNGAAGMPHLDTLGPFAGWLMKDCGFTPMRVAEALAVAPGQILDPYIARSQGRIEERAAASLTLLDLSGSTLVVNGRIKERGPLKTRCGWSPFEGLRLPGTVRETIVLGTRYRS